MKKESDSSSGVPPMPFMTQLKSFDGTYWWCNWMELIERFAYYGVRVMLPVFMVDSLGKGGPELTQIQKGNIFAFALVVQSFVPILSGGFADRYGYKINIAAATVLKIIGYLIMGYTVPLSEMLAGMPASSGLRIRLPRVLRGHCTEFHSAVFLQRTGPHPRRRN